MESIEGSDVKCMSETKKLRMEELDGDKSLRNLLY